MMIRYTVDLASLTTSEFDTRWAEIKVKVTIHRLENHQLMGAEAGRRARRGCDAVRRECGISSSGHLQGGTRGRPASEPVRQSVPLPCLAV
ncbi:hypothetical protein E2C01_102732 [Portunus trituberculatus]|uniref:Uncharacterized protein n=1 Tax=Portunus trituberculatus TaxID=210409 RepID=A0A5B7KNH3_PORTR|nr:hypothetical protein [Portunus trituberculatus]